MPRHTHARRTRDPWPGDRRATHLDQLARRGKLVGDGRAAADGAAAAARSLVEQTPSGLLVARFRPAAALDSPA